MNVYSVLNHFCLRPKAKDLGFTWVVVLVVVDLGFFVQSMHYELPPPCYPQVLYLTLYLSIHLSLYPSIYWINFVRGVLFRQTECSVQLESKTKPKFRFSKSKLASQPVRAWGFAFSTESLLLLLLLCLKWCRTVKTHFVNLFSLIMVRYRPLFLYFCLFNWYSWQ